jgi:GH15 family glucan-1,4-alpha-glucosidase
VKSLDLALIGNCAIGALIDASTEIVWACMPRFDADPVFCSLLRNGKESDEQGLYRIDLIDLDHSEQAYLENTAILVTRLYDRHGGAIEVTDFAPRFSQFGRMFCPMMLIRRVRRLAGSPRVRIVLRPNCDYGAHRPQHTVGSHHIRFVATDQVLRLTTDASLTAVEGALTFFLQDAVTLILGADETIADSVGKLGERFLSETSSYWRQFVRYLGIPFEWQEAVIRAAITLKLNTYEDTGAIIAAMTTSIPEAAGSERNWDYRFCWLRDGYFVVNALNRLGATGAMERYLAYIVNVAAAGTTDSILQPVYGIDGSAQLDERQEHALAGYRGMGPVRVGNLAYRQVQHDVYGSAILTATHVFFDRRLERRGVERLFRRLESLGEKAAVLWDQPDAGLWELRGRAHVHTFSAVMCWAACDRLALIAAALNLLDRTTYWADHAARIHRGICASAWNAQRGSFASSFGGASMDASLLLLHELGFLAADDPRFAATVTAIENDLKHGEYIFRYGEADDFGKPENAFVVCTFWYIYALVALGRTAEARTLFEHMLRCRNRHGLLAEHIDPRTGEAWGNFPQTYSMVGLINAAMLLSRRWDRAF